LISPFNGSAELITRFVSKIENISIANCFIEMVFPVPILKISPFLPSIFFIALTMYSITSFT